MEVGFLLADKEIKSKNKFSVKNYFTGKIFARVSIPSKAKIEKAIFMAEEAFKETKKMTSYQRADALEYISNKLKEKKEYFAKIISEEAGKPIKHALNEVDRAVLTFKIGAEEAKRIPSEVLPIDLNYGGKNKLSIVQRFPIGIISAITPFNFPLNLVAHKISPALAAGNTIIVKPSERTPVSAIMLGKIINEAGFPKGTISVLPVDRNNSEIFVKDERFKMLSFTGSAPIGWMLKDKAGKKKVALELGGNAAVIVDESANLTEAAKRIVPAAFGYSGQSCISVQRVLIHKNVYEKFKTLVKKEITKLKIGDPMNKNTDIGPMINELEAKRIEEWVNEAKKEGAKIISGGKRKNAIYYPTILENVKSSNKCYSEEAFAPLMVLKKVSNIKQAIKETNDSRYGLQAGIFTQNIDNAFKAYWQIEAGGVLVNDIPTFRVDNYPYGGIKDSGFGREGVKYAIEEMTELKIGIFELGDFK